MSFAFGNNAVMKIKEVTQRQNDLVRADYSFSYLTGRF